MEKKTIGKFIAVLRKANGLTQKELAEKLFVSDKTVSRWETDECTPDLNLIPTIAEIFNVTTDELLRGERNKAAETLSKEANEQRKEKSNKRLNLMLNERKKLVNTLTCISVATVAIGIIIAAICVYAFDKGSLGFLISTIFFLGTVTVKACCAVNFRIAEDNFPDCDYNIKIKKFNTGMILRFVKLLLLDVAAFGFCVILAPFRDYYIEIEAWLFGGGICAISFFIVAFCVYKIFIKNVLIKKNLIYLDEKKIIAYEKERKLLIISSLVFIITALVLLIVFSKLIPLVRSYDTLKTYEFNDVDDFIEFVQKEYDDWYEEGYLLPPETYEGEYPDKKIAEISGKEYYYNPALYENIEVKYTRDNKVSSVTVVRIDDYNKWYFEWQVVQFLPIIIIVSEVLILAIVYFLYKRKYGF